MWQWIRSPKGVLDDGRTVSDELPRASIPEELAKVKVSGAEGRFDPATEIFEQMSTQQDFAEFPTLPPYEEIRAPSAQGCAGPPPRPASPREPTCRARGAA